MTNVELKLCIEIGEYAKQIRENQKEIESLHSENDFMMRQINRLLTDHNGTELTLEDILNA